MGSAAGRSRYLLPGHGGVQFSQGVQGHRTRHLVTGRRAELLLGEGEVRLQRHQRHEVLRRRVLQHRRAVAGNDGGQVEVGLQLPAGGKEILGFLHGRQPGAERAAVVGRVVLGVQRLGHQPQGGDELGPGRVAGPAIGQLEAVADLLVGLPGRLLQLLAPRGRRLRRQQQRAGRLGQSPRGARRRRCPRRLASTGAVGNRGANSCGPSTAADESGLAGMAGNAAANTAEPSRPAAASFSSFAPSGEVVPRVLGGWDTGDGGAPRQREFPKGWALSTARRSVSVGDAHPTRVSLGGAASRRASHGRQVKIAPSSGMTTSRGDRRRLRRSIVRP